VALKVKIAQSDFAARSELTLEPVLGGDGGADADVAADGRNGHVVGEEGARHSGPVLQQDVDGLRRGCKALGGVLI